MIIPAAHRPDPPSLPSHPTSSLKVTLTARPEAASMGGERLRQQSADEPREGGLAAGRAGFLKPISWIPLLFPLSSKFVGFGRCYHIKTEDQSNKEQTR